MLGLVVRVLVLRKEGGFYIARKTYCRIRGRIGRGSNSIMEFLLDSRALLCRGKHGIFDGLHQL